MTQPIAFPWNPALRLGASLLVLAVTLPAAKAADDVDIACDFVGETDEVKCYDMDKINACMAYHDGETSCFNPDNEADQIDRSRIKRFQSAQSLKLKLKQ